MFLREIDIEESPFILLVCEDYIMCESIIQYRVHLLFVIVVTNNNRRHICRDINREHV